MKWLVYGRIVATKFIGEFEAETAEEAENMADEQGGAYVSLCHQCSKQMDDPEVEGYITEPKHADNAG